MTTGAPRHGHGHGHDHGRGHGHGHAHGGDEGLLGRGERVLLGLRLGLALGAACLLLVAVGLRLLGPDARPLSELVAGAAAALVAVPVLAAAWHSLRHPSLHGVTDRLVALALVAAWATGDLLTAALLPIIMTAGHVLEERSLLGSQEAVRALGRLVEQGASRLRPDGTEERVGSDALRVGDRVVLRAGDRLAADGIVRAGAASLDLATLTGESAPVDVAAGAPAPAGALNADGWLEVELTRVGGESTLGRIIGAMRDAEAAKPPVTRMLDRHAGQYLLLVLTVAAGTWFATQDMAATLAVLVAACPCALVLAAPATAVAAIAVAARHGILIKGSAFLEQLADVTSVVFDKTGTVTSGTLRLHGAVPAPGVAREELLRVAGSLGAASSHPVSRAAGAALAEAGLAALALDGRRELGGLGLQAVLAGAAGAGADAAGAAGRGVDGAGVDAPGPTAAGAAARGGEAAGAKVAGAAAAGAAVVAFGRPELLERLGVVVPPPPAHDGPLAGAARGGRFLGWLLFADAPRPEAAAAVAELRAMGLDRQLLLTGDRAAVARAVADSVGIAEVCAGVLPEGKLARVLAEVADGQRPLVVGDGINDGLALRAGAVGVAIGAGGTDVALAAADLVLMTGDLRRLPTCIRLGRRCRRTVHTNVALGLGWTVLLVAAAATGLLGAEGAVLAAVLHNVGTFAGLGNSGRLLLFDERLEPVGV